MRIERKRIQCAFNFVQCGQAFKNGMAVHRPEVLHSCIYYFMAYDLRTLTSIGAGMPTSRYFANFGDRDIYLAIDTTDSGDCHTDSKYGTCTV